MSRTSLSHARYDIVVVGSGPNGLAAAVTLARAGLSTLVVEAHATPGGGLRSGALTEPGFVHDVCSAVHPLARASPLFRALDLERYGLSFIDPAAPLAHVLNDGRAVTLERSLDDTVAQLGPDGRAYRRLLQPFVRRFDALAEMFLGPLRVPSSPILFARFGLVALRSMCGLAASRFSAAPARALLAGISSHGMLPLDALTSSSFALLLGSAGHAVGWPIARGGSQAIADALVACLRAHGGELVCDRPVQNLDELPRARAYVLDVTPRQLLAIAGHRLPFVYRARLGRYRYGPGVFKVDWALRGPVPWKDPACARAGTVHLAGDLPDLAAAEAAAHAGQLAERPFVLFAQPSLFDPTRAPARSHTAWGYCHVPHGATLDATDAIEAQIERVAPGFRDLVLARSTRTAAALERYNPNCVGGDISGGVTDLTQLFLRPVARLDPYSTPAPDIFLCSSSTPPGGGVHGMCGYYAARSVLRRVFGRHALAPGSPRLPREHVGDHERAE